MRGKPLYEQISKTALQQVYEKERSLEGVSRVTGFDPGAIRKLIDRYNIPFRYKTIYEHDDEYFSRPSEGQIYWAGFIGADGCIKEKNKNTKILAISLANKDKEHIAKFKRDVAATEPIKEYDNHSSIHIVSDRMCSDLEIFNVVPRKTHKYKFPNVSETVIHHFMRGYFDGDGGLYLNNSGQMFFSLRGTIRFLTRYQEILVNRCGVRKTKIGKNCGIGQMQYCGNGNCRKIRDFLYQDSSIYLDRKHKLLFSI